MSEVRRTADSNPMRVGGQARPEPRALPEDGDAWGGWRRNVWKCMNMNRGYLFWRWKEQDRSQSPHSSEEASNDRGAKEDREVEAGEKQNCKDNCRECLWLRKAEQQSGAVDQMHVGKARKSQRQAKQKICALPAQLGVISLASLWVNARQSWRRDHRLESRMREIRPSGLEGGARLIPRSYPYHKLPPSRAPLEFREVVESIRPCGASMWRYLLLCLPQRLRRNILPVMRSVEANLFGCAVG